MLTFQQQPVPSAGRVRIATDLLPSGAALSAVSLDGIGARMDAERMSAAQDVARAEAMAVAEETALKAFGAAIEAIETARDEAEEALASQSTALAVDIASELIKVRIHAGEYDLERMVRSTLAAADDQRGVLVVHLHPDDAALLAESPFRDGTELVASETVPRGAVHVETPSGLLVRDPETVLEQIREQLLEDIVR